MPPSTAARKKGEHAGIATREDESGGWLFDTLITLGGAHVQVPVRDGARDVAMRVAAAESAVTRAAAAHSVRCVVIRVDRLVRVQKEGVAFGAATVLQSRRDMKAAVRLVAPCPSAQPRNNRSLEKGVRRRRDEKVRRAFNLGCSMRGSRECVGREDATSYNEKTETRRYCCLIRLQPSTSGATGCVQGAASATFA